MQNLRRKTLIEELPEHPGIHDALDSLHKEGVRLIVPLCVLQEAVDHIRRAWKTYRRFGGSLVRMTPEVVDSNVWHALVRGFYYSDSGGEVADFHVYWSKYYDEKDPIGFGRFLLEDRITCEIIESMPIGPQDEGVFEELAQNVLTQKEPDRMKARYRDELQMEGRTREHVACALYAAGIGPVGSRSGVVGYVVSDDMVFRHIQTRREWGDRPKVHLDIARLLALVELACGARLGDEQFLNLMFNPVLAAAADDVADELAVLAKVGVELRGVDVLRLEWDLTKTFQASLLDYDRAARESHEAGIASAISIASVAATCGYSLDPQVGEVVAEFNKVTQEAADERRRREEADRLIRRLADAASGLTKKGKRRFNAIMREIGGLPVFDDVADGKTRPDQP